MTGLEIRPIEPGDKAALAAAVDQSSDEAVYRRFLNPHGRLTAAELRYLTEVDHRDHEALVALDPASSESVGVARYVRDPERRESAEIAVAVLEQWQGRGVTTTGFTRPSSALRTRLGAGRSLVRIQSPRSQ